MFYFTNVRFVSDKCTECNPILSLVPGDSQAFSSPAPPMCQSWYHLWDTLFPYWIRSSQLLEGPKQDLVKIFVLSVNLSSFPFIESTRSPLEQDLILNYSCHLSSYMNLRSYIPSAPQLHKDGISQWHFGAMIMQSLVEK